VVKLLDYALIPAQHVIGNMGKSDVAVERMTDLRTGLADRRPLLCAPLFGRVAHAPQGGAYGFAYDRSVYGAIAYDRQSGAYGFAYDQASPVAAGRRALDKCGSPGCALVLEFVDGCGAYATGPNAAAGAGSDYTRTTAEDRALAQCRSAGGNCQVQVWTCNSTPGTEPPPTAPLEPGLYFGPLRR
jgi:hypothetical protein